MLGDMTENLNHDLKDELIIDLPFCGPVGNISHRHMGRCETQDATFLDSLGKITVAATLSSNDCELWDDT